MYFFRLSFVEFNQFIQVDSKLGLFTVASWENNEKKRFLTSVLNFAFPKCF